MSHTVDEVSELLDVPRPTLYRYLKEYSIPHIRHSGKIYVPEESFNRIREVRELHKEGLGTESVRRRLQEERSNLDIEGLTKRLDRISEALENLQGNLKPVNSESSAQSLQTILVKQNLLISAVLDLTEMLEDFPATNGQRRKSPFGDVEEVIRKQKTYYFGEPEEHPEKTENGANVNRPVIETLPGSTTPPTTLARRRRFGTLAKRRRLGILVILLTLLTSTALTAAVALSGEESSGASQMESSAPSQEATPIRSEEIDAGDPDAASPDSPGYVKEGLARYDEEGYENSVSEPLSYQVQDFTPEPFSQEYPWFPPTPVDSPSP